MGNAATRRFHSTTVATHGEPPTNRASSRRRSRNRWNSLGELVHLASQQDGLQGLSLGDLFHELMLQRELPRDRTAKPSSSAASTTAATTPSAATSIPTSATPLLLPSYDELCPHQIRQQLQFVQQQQQQQLQGAGSDPIGSLLEFRPVPCLSCAQPLRKAILQNPMLLQLLVLGPLHRELPARLGWDNLSLFQDVAGVLRYLVEPQPPAAIPAKLPQHPALAAAFQRPVAPGLDLVWALRCSRVSQRLKQALGPGTRRQTLEEEPVSTQGVAGELQRIRIELWSVVDTIEGRDVWLAQLWAFAAASKTGVTTTTGACAAGDWMRSPLWDRQLLKIVFSFVWKAPP